MSRFFLMLFSALLIQLSVFSSENALADTVVAKDYSVNFSGFVRSDLFHDTRKQLDAVDGLFVFYPLRPEYGADLNDLNAESNTHFVSFSSRLGTTITGPDVFNAKITGFIELDFTNFNNMAGVRFRHGFTRLDWEKSSLLVGLFWHPLFVTDVFPTVMALSTGAPFQVFNRSPQIHFSYKPGSIRFIATAAYQGDYQSVGPYGRTANYMRYANLPNLSFLAQYENKNVVFGVGSDFKQLRPRLFIEQSEGLDIEKYRTNERISSFSFLSYMKYKTEKLEIKSKVLLGQNLYEHLMIGGYAVKSTDPLTGYEKYTPYNHLFLWANVIYGQKTKFGFFGGYASNLGTNDIITGNIYARGEDISKLYRISPHVVHTISKLALSAELETNIVTYGSLMANTRGKLEDLEDVTSTRLLITMCYHF